MNAKNKLMLAIIILSLFCTSFSEISSFYKGLNYLFASETKKSEAGREIELVLDNGSVVNCAVQDRKSSVRSAGNKGMAVSISSNWLCR